MATTNINQKCSKCNEENDTYPCKGCQKNFCIVHLLEHREEIKQDFHEIEHNYNVFQQNILDQKDSIEKMKQTANECRQKLIKYLNKYITVIDEKLKDLFEQLRKISKENKFNETYLEQFKNKLNKLREELNKPSNVSIQQEKSFSLIDKIFIIISSDKDTKWKQYGITIAEGHGEGNLVNQLYRPWGICIDDHQTIYIANCENHRIIEWKSNAPNGRIVAGGNGKGDQMNQLNDPADVIIDKKHNSLIISDYGNRRVIEWSLENNTSNGKMITSNIRCFGLAIDKNGDIYVCDEEKHEVRRWKRDEKKGTLVAGGNGQGNQFNQLSSPRYIFIDDDLSLYISDCGNHRVMKWVKDAKEGKVIAGGNGNGNTLSQLSIPEELIVDQFGQIYVVDGHNHQIMRWCKENKQGTIVVGGNGDGDQSNQLSYPTGLSFDQLGNLYVSDCRNHRIQKFEIA